MVQSNKWAHIERPSFIDLPVSIALFIAFGFAAIIIARDPHVRYEPAEPLHPASAESAVAP